MECSRSLSLSREEENELARSTKKVKDSHNVTTDGSLARHGTLPTKLSFKDKLVGEVPEPTPKLLLSPIAWMLNQN